MNAADTPSNTVAFLRGIASQLAEIQCPHGLRLTNGEWTIFMKAVVGRGQLE